MTFITETKRIKYLGIIIIKAIEHSRKNDKNIEIVLIRKNIFSGLSCECPLPHSEVQPVCLLRKSSDTTRKFSGPA